MISGRSTVRPTSEQPMEGDATRGIIPYKNPAGIGIVFGGITAVLWGGLIALMITAV